MKRCPECRRDYYDETLRFCLDDGTALLDGPATLEPETQILREPGSSGESVTIPAFSTPAKPATGDVDRPELGKSRSSTKNRIFLAIGIGLIVTAAAAVAVYKSGYLRASPAVRFERIKISRATNEGNVQSVAVSPDGKYLAYTTVDGSANVLWTKHLATNSRVQIATPSGGVGLLAGTFSPDSNYVLYGVRENRAFDLYQVPVLGGQSKKILSKISPNISFSPKGTQIAFTRLNYEQLKTSIMIANADGSDERLIAERKVPEDLGFNGVSWSPDGSTLATTYTDANANSFLATINIADTSVNVLSGKSFKMMGAVKWLPSGKGLIFAGEDQASEANKVWYTSDITSDPRSLTEDLNSYSSSSISLTADGTTVFSVQRQSTSNVYISDMRDPTAAKRVAGRTVVNDGANGLSWDQSGRLFSVSQDEDKSDTWMIEPNAPTPKTVMNEAGGVYNLTVSPDGRYLVFISRRSGEWDIWRMEINGASLRRLTTNANPSPWLSISPDSKWVLYTTVDTTVRRIPIDGGQSETIANTPTISYAPQLSPDGRYLACVDWTAQNGPSLTTFTVNGDAITLYKTFDLPPTSGPVIHWAPDGRSIVYPDKVGRVSNLWQLPLESGKAKQLTNFDSELITNFAFSLDGKQLALARGVVISDAVAITDSK